MGLTILSDQFYSNSSVYDSETEVDKEIGQIMDQENLFKLWKVTRIADRSEF